MTHWQIRFPTLGTITYWYLGRRATRRLDPLDPSAVDALEKLLPFFHCSQPLSLALHKAESRQA